MSKQKAVQEPEEEFVTTNFAFQVAKHVIQERMAERESVICSPVSIDAILSILAAGAENATLDQLLTLLGHADVSQLNVSASRLADVLIKGSDTDGAPQINFVNALWLDRRFPLKSEFQKVLRDVHNTEARGVDFVNQADKEVKEANSWAEKEAKGLIKQILSRNSVNGLTVFILANALYFRGKWHKYFESKHTKDAYFNFLNGDKVRVPMMNQWSRHFNYGTFDEYKVLKMPYKIGKSSDDDEASMKAFSMYVFLPHENDGLTSLMERIKIDGKFINDLLKLQSVKISHLSIPKFKFECDVSLKEPMRQLGLKLPFKENCRDFLGITDILDPVYVSNIDQKCYIETDERGTKAAAITRAILRYGSKRPSKPPPPPTNFVADHPFMFMVMEENSGAVLFVGTVLDPR